ncbi:MAG TPA: DUF2249 domain-containing protein [Armatimonadota bacterium]|nr:DUF2249 domain-containing protein [Armatimonadota bacterium]
MAESAIVAEVDVRPLPAPQKHPAIFTAYASLNPGQSMLLINDHEPRPLYYQFLIELPDQFEWEYLETGPEVWQVRIGKK